ncbi:hypothetical protein [Enteractinococcus helveticum]|uniref:Uncharacterized protein n=1 Tax=Enteractinococcus helveticum TaxID=1837282 RepID=A0A1B7M2R4_9MICC|nr:hypothetical protein [Enteractinococcus helveticum]OAV62888.1 hypothetical protein A6F49_04320 [Enteractinococcus helveticum]
MVKTDNEIVAQEVQVRNLGEKGSELAVFEFQGELRDLMISSMHEAYLTTGNYASDARAVAPQSAISAAFAGTSLVATGLSSTFSSSLFMATANPSTLMQLKNGSGFLAAVRGPNGIIRQAPFIPVASSLPTVAPIIALQTLQTAMMMQQFQEVDRKLDRIKDSLDTVIARAEAKYAGELLSASGVVDEVYRQYELEGQFSQDMLIRLSLAERDVRSLAIRFRLFVDEQPDMTVLGPDKLEQANYDAYSAMFSSFLDLRIAYLRVCVDMQENPKSVGSTVDLLKAKIDDSTEFWTQLLERSQLLKNHIDELEADLEDMNVAERFTKFIGSRGAATGTSLDQLNTVYRTMTENERKISQSFHSLIEATEKTRKKLDDPQLGHDGKQTLVYWKDETGTHSFVTDQLELA